MIIFEMCYRLRVLFQNNSKNASTQKLKHFTIVLVVFLPILVFFANVLFNFNSPFEINQNIHMLHSDAIL